VLVHRDDPPRAALVGGRALVLSLTALLVLPLMTQKVLGGNRQSVATIGSTVVLRQVDLVQVVLAAVTGAVCLFLMVRGRPGRAGGVLVAFLVPWLALSATNLVNGVAPTATALAYVLIVVALWRVGAPLAALAALGMLGGVVAAVSVALGVLWPPLGLYFNAAGQSLDAGKGLIFDKLLSGVFLSTNNLGQFLVLALPFAFLLSRRWLAIACVAASAYAIMWSGSRSSIGAMAAVLVTVGVVGATANTARRGKTIATFLLASAAAICVVLPFLAERSPSLFSGRGRIWHLALDAWWREPWSGLGSDWFLREAGMRTELGSRSVYTLFHGHNQFLHLLVTGGVITALAVAAMLLVACRAALRLEGRKRAVAVAYLVAFFVSGSLELNLGIVDRYQFWVTSLVPLMVIALAGRPTSSREAAHHTPHSKPVLVER